MIRTTGIKDISKDKATANIYDTRIILRVHAAWGSDLDSTSPTSGRQLVQFALTLLLIGYSSSRPGSVVESVCYRKINQCGVTYQHRRLVKASRRGNPPKPVSERTEVLGKERKAARRRALIGIKKMGGSLRSSEPPKATLMFFLFWGGLELRRWSRNFFFLLIQEIPHQFVELVWLGL